MDNGIYVCGDYYRSIRVFGFMKISIVVELRLNKVVSHDLVVLIEYALKVFCQNVSISIPLKRE